MNYERHRKQDYFFLNLLIPKEKVLKESFEEKNNKAESYLCSIIEYIKSIKDLQKRRKALNWQYDKYDSITPLLLVIKFHKEYSAGECLPEIIEFMIKNGADIRIKDNNSRNIFHYIIKYCKF